MSVLVRLEGVFLVFMIVSAMLPGVLVIMRVSIRGVRVLMRVLMVVLMAVQM